jgi:CheY-like chemotaxis protein
MAPRVLVADDDDAMRTTVAFMLDDEGFETTEAASGVEVLRLLESAESARRGSSGFDLIIMDIRMPGLSGLETVRMLRRLRCSTPVILMTAFAGPETADAAKRLRVPLLSKPFPLAELTALAQRTLDARAAT